MLMICAGLCQELSRILTYMVTEAYFHQRFCPFIRKSIRIDNLHVEQIQERHFLEIKKSNAKNHTLHYFFLFPTISNYFLLFLTISHHSAKFPDYSSLFLMISVLFPTIPSLFCIIYLLNQGILIKISLRNLVCNIIIMDLHPQVRCL